MGSSTRALLIRDVIGTADLDGTLLLGVDANLYFVVWWCLVREKYGASHMAIPPPRTWDAIMHAYGMSASWLPEIEAGPPMVCCILISRAGGA